MMQVLEMLAFKADMRKIMLTVLKHNPSAKTFFKECMKFEIDETCPIDDVYEQFDYEILSKFNKRKLALEASQQSESQIKYHKHFQYYSSIFYFIDQYLQKKILMTT